MFVGALRSATASTTDHKKLIEKKFITLSRSIDHESLVLRTRPHVNYCTLAIKLPAARLSQTRSASSVVSVRPGGVEPLVWVLGHVLPRGSLALPLGDVVAGQVVQGVCRVGAGAHVDGRLLGGGRVSVRLQTRVMCSV